MKYEVVISAQAEDDLREIFDYIAYELQAPLDAVNQLDRLEKNIFSLEFMPNRFRAFEREPWLSRGLRILPVDNFLVLYILDEISLTVTIIRVMYGARAVENNLTLNSKI